MAPPPAAAADRDLSTPAAAAGSASSPQQDAQTRWLQTLSEPELDLLVSLKEYAVTMATGAGRPDIADRFRLRSLRSLVVVLLQILKGPLKQTSGDTDMYDRLALLSDPDVDNVPSHGSTSQPAEVPCPDQDQPMLNGKRKQMQNGSNEEGARSPKNRKMEDMGEESTGNDQDST